MDRLRAAYDPERFREQGHRLVDLLASYLAGALRGCDLDGASLAVLPVTSPDALVAEWSERLGVRRAGGGAPPEGEAAAPAHAGAGTLDLPALVERVLAQSNHLHHPGYVGHQVPPPLPAAALADLVAALLNNSMAVYEMGPAATAIERAVLRWMADRLGYPASADGVLTSGGSLGNLTALLAARQRKAGFDAWGGGAHAGPPLAILASAASHYSVARAAQMMGLGAGGVVPVACDARHRLDPRALDGALQEAERRGRRAIAVVAAAGSTATGAYDPLAAIADVCERHSLWLHVDAAHGAAAALSPRHRALLDGIDRADSVVWDAHKMLLTPALVTGVLFRDGLASYEAFAQEASYLFAGDDPREAWYDVASRTLECTKRMLGLVAFAAIADEATLAEFVDRSFALARDFAALLRREPDFEVALEPEANIVCFRHVPPGTPAAQLDELQARVRQRVVAGGRYYLVQTRLGERLHLRTALMNPLTTLDDLRGLLAAIRVAARGGPSL